MTLLSHICSAMWAMEVTAFDRMLSILERHDQGVKLTDSEITSAIGRAPRTAHPRDRAYEVHQGVAIIPVQGVLHKHASQVQDISGPSGTSYETVTGHIATALSDPEVKSILLHVESPGGAVDGMAQMGDAVRNATSQKPTWAFIDGMGASAAYRMVAPCSRILATPAALVGSIGTMMVMRDTSAAAEKSGVKTVVVRSSPLKGGAIGGEPVTDAMRADQQRIIDGMAAQFYAAVGEARGLAGDDLVAVTDGRVHLAAEAQKLGLIDGISTFEQALAAITDPTQAKRRGAAPISPRALSAHQTTTTAGDRPAPQGINHMKISPEVLATMVRENQAQAVLITSMAAGSATQEPADEATIRAALKDEEHKGAKAQVVDLTAKLAKADGDLAAAKTAHAAAITAKDAEIAKLTAECAEAKALAGKKGVPALEGATLPDPKAADPEAAYQDKVKELRAAGDKQPFRTIAAKFPDLHQARLAAVQPQKGATK